MATRIEIEADDIRQLAAQLRQALRVVHEESAVAMERGAILVRNEAKRNIQRQNAIDTGQLLNSIAYERPVQPFEAKVGTNKVYARRVEEGTPAGEPMIPQGELLPWMARHGIPAEREFLVRRSIQRKGIRARPFLHPALESNRTAINREFAAANRRVAQRLTQ